MTTRAGTIFRCRFDRPLKDQPLDKGNWRLWQSMQRYDLSSCFVDGDSVIGFTVRVGGLPKPNQCAYFATPPDVQSLSGSPAAAFGGFPLQVH
jgi:hypothetical protein